MDDIYKTNVFLILMISFALLLYYLFSKNYTDCVYESINDSFFIKNAYLYKCAYPDTRPKKLQQVEPSSCYVYNSQTGLVEDCSRDETYLRCKDENIFSANDSLYICKGENVLPFEFKKSSVVVEDGVARPIIECSPGVQVYTKRNITPFALDVECDERARVMVQHNSVYIPKNNILQLWLKT